ncbi:transglutaminase domain-containing protein [Clostridium estertheticum]|uniref:transglutaminase domain-containing protein n=1 Tax=Clostridium estertheticum TaxID=238834 RepID=UPI001C0E7FB7|nr:transglutaminase domain-containing protein [Clostridium estertheticum]MBU3183874.1 hypothetical protein [Clostridium estertheticum]
MKTSKKISRVLLSLIIVLGVSVSSIGSLVYANQINGKTKTGSVSLIGGNRLKQSNYIKNFSNVYATKTINKSEAVVTYNVTTIDEFKAKVNYAISNRVSEVNINYTGSKSVGDSINFMQDTVLTAVKTAGNDYEKNLLKSYAYSITEFGDNEFNVVYTFDYLESKEQENQVKAKVKEMLGQIITSDMTEGQRVKAINSYICKKLSYDTTHTNFSAYEGLLGSGKTVCQGYALLAYRMLTDAGLQARIITGAAYNGNDSESHAWNMVMVGSSWYHLDTTWNDPLPDVNGRVIETYSLCSDAEMRLDHSWDKTLFPVASKKYNVYTDTTVPKILAAMQKSVTLNSSYVSVAKGKVCVKGLLAGDIINVYAVNPALTKGAKAISKATVSRGYSYLFAAFKTTASKLYVTRTSVNKLESVAITIKSK